MAQEGLAEIDARGARRHRPLGARRGEAHGATIAHAPWLQISWSAQPESGNFEGCDALIHFNNAADAVLTFFQRFPGGSASGDEEVIKAIRQLHFRF